MTVSFGFYNSVGGDRTYNAEQMSRIFDGIIEDGVFITVGNALAVVESSNMDISVGSGRAWFNHTWTLNDASIILTVDTAEVVLDRIDTVVLEVDTTDSVRANTIKIIKGTPSSTPVAPTLTHTAYVNQYPLADIAVGNGVTAITNADITNRIGTVDTPWITSPLESVSIDAFYLRWEAEMAAAEATMQQDFLDWFDEMQGQLSTDAAGNLQLQIDALEEVVAGLSTSGDSGWFDIPDTDTWTYVSTAADKGTIDVTGDRRDTLKKGTRVQYTQNVALTGAWSFDTNSAAGVGTFTMGDIGTPTYTPGKFSNALTLDGSTDALSITDVSTLKPTSTPFTFGAWVKTSASTQQVIFQSFAAVTNSAGFRIEIGTDGKVKVTIGPNSSSVMTMTGSSVINDGNWHYVAYTQSNNYGRLYVNGLIEYESYIVSPAYQTTNYIRIGCGNNNGTNILWLNGQIDDLYFINGYALDAYTILNKFKAGTAQGVADIPVVKKGAVISVSLNSGGATSRIVVFHGFDYALQNATITLPKYATVERPSEFPKFFTWFPTPTDLTLGNATATCHVKLTTSCEVLMNVHTILGSTSSITGAIILSMPVPSDMFRVVGGVANDYTTVGPITYVDAATATYNGFVFLRETQGYLQFRVTKVDQPYAVHSYISNIIPFTWTNGDAFDAVIRYPY